LRLPSPSMEIRLEVPATASPGERIVIKGIVPEELAGATVRVSLLRPMGSLPKDLEALPDKPAEKRARVMTENHQRANNVVLGTREIKSNGNAFECEMELPEKLAAKKVIIQAYAATEKESVYGTAVMPLKGYRGQSALRH
jgi:hypothetical protein